MSNNKPTRDIIKIIFQNFLNSFKPRQFRGNYIGEDYFGNKYYEIPANPGIGKRKPSRWFEPTQKDAFDQELTAEWEAWLRGRRTEPPTKEELVKNLQIMELKKRNAAKLEVQYAEERAKLHDKPVAREPDKIGTFPKYDEFETVPNTDSSKKIK